MNKKCVLLVVLSLLIISIVVFVLYNKNENNIAYKKEISIKIGDDVPKIEDYVDSKDLKKIKDKNIDFKDLKIEDNKVYYSGIYEGSFKFNDKTINISLKVIDDEEPKIEIINDITIYEKDDIDFSNKFKVTDNSHDDIDTKVEGTYDVNKKGEYNLKYIAIDKSGNKSEKEFKLIVKEKKTDGEVVGTTSKGYEITLKNGIYYVDGILIANKTYKLPSNYAPGGLLKEFTDNFNKMKSDALKSGIKLNVVSGYRSYTRQSTLYNNYVKKDGKAAADTYSARPGYSEHQSGLAADINSVEESFINTKEGKWLNENCYKYGFIIRYPKGKDEITGYIYEPWHIRYVGTNISSKLYNNGSWTTLEEYLGITSNYE